MPAQRDEIAKYIKKKYKADPEALWAKTPNCVIFRHADNRKWFALIMDIERDRLGFDSPEVVDILNVKITDMMLKDALLQQRGYLPAYHMSKTHWITILLDGSVSMDTICGLIDESFGATATVVKRRVKRKRID